MIFSQREIRKFKSDNDKHVGGKVIKFAFKIKTQCINLGAYTDFRKQWEGWLLLPVSPKSFRGWTFNKLHGGFGYLTHLFIWGQLLHLSKVNFYDSHRFFFFWWQTSNLRGMPAPLIYLTQHQFHACPTKQNNNKT